MRKKIKVCVNGACGRMGLEVIRTVMTETGMQLGAALDRHGHPQMGTDVGELSGIGAIGVHVIEGLKKNQGRSVNVMIDFSSPDGSRKALKDCRTFRIPLVVCTTGLPQGLVREMELASRKIPILRSPNMSLGINLLFYLVEEVAATLGDSFDVEIIETHHRFKKDAPSGTALALAERIARVRGIKATGMVYGRKGHVGERKTKEIGISAVRAGDVVGDHAVVFGGKGERIELIHRAHTRSTFAYGAVQAAKFLVRKKSGFYTMADVLGKQRR